MIASSYASTDGFLRRIDPADGTVLWDATTARYRYGCITIDGATVFARVGTDNDLTAFSAADGSQKWSITPDNAFFEATGGVGLVATQVSDNIVEAYSEADGTKLWFNDDHPGSASIEPLAASPDGQRIYVCSGRATDGFRAINAADGTTAWKASTVLASLCVAVSADSATVCVGRGGDAPAILVYQASDGTLLDTIDLPVGGSFDTGTPSSIAVNDETVYVSHSWGTSDRILAYDLAAGTLSTTFADRATSTGQIALTPDGTILSSIGTGAAEVVGWLPAGTVGWTSVTPANPSLPSISVSRP